MGNGVWTRPGRGGSKIFEMYQIEFGGLLRAEVRADVLISSTRWHVSIGATSVGRFDTFEEAIAAANKRLLENEARLMEDWAHFKTNKKPMKRSLGRY